MIKKLRFLSTVQAKLGAFRTRRNKLKTAQAPPMIQLPHAPCLHTVTLYTTNNFMFLTRHSHASYKQILLFKMRRCAVSKVSESTCQTLKAYDFINDLLYALDKPITHSCVLSLLFSVPRPWGWYFLSLES